MVDEDPHTGAGESPPPANGHASGTAAADAEPAGQADHAAGAEAVEVPEPEAGTEQPEPEAGTEEPDPTAGTEEPEPAGTPGRNSEDQPGEEEPQTALPGRVEGWRKRSATGAILTGLALGLREVLETEQREPAIVLETSGQPPSDLPVEADLDNVPPRRSTVTIRRWLLPERAELPEDQADSADEDPRQRQAD